MALFARRHKRKPIRRNKERGIGRQIFVGILLILFITLLSTGVWYGTRLPEVTIAEVVVTGGETVSHDEIKSVVREELSGSYLVLVPKRFSYLYPRERIEEAVERIPRVHNVSVDRESRTTLTLSFDEYVPHALACASREETAPCFFMDVHGYAFAPAPPLRGGAFVRHVIEGASLEAKTAVLPSPSLASADQFMDALRDTFNFRIITVHHEKSGDVSYYVSGGGALLTSEKVDTQDTLENLTSILESSEFSHLRPGNFNYIDLRFGNKVFVNEELEEGPATTTDAAEATDEELSDSL